MFKGKSQFLMGKSPCLMGKSQFLMGISQLLMGKSPFLMGKTQFLMGKTTINHHLYRSPLRSAMSKRARLSCPNGCSECPIGGVAGTGTNGCVFHHVVSDMFSV